MSYPGANDYPGQALPFFHMIICYRQLISTNLSEFLYFYTNRNMGGILNTCNYFWCFLEHSIVKFILNVYNEHAHDYSYPGQLLRSVHVTSSMEAFALLF